MKARVQCGGDVIISAEQLSAELFEAAGCYPLRKKLTDSKCAYYPPKAHTSQLSMTRSRQPEIYGAEGDQPYCYKKASCHLLVLLCS